MTWLLRAGRVILVIAVIFFLAAGVALGKAAPDAAVKRDAHRSRPAIHFPTDWVTTPVLLLKDAVLVRSRALRAGEAAMVGIGVDLLTRAIQWVRDLGLAQVEAQGGSTAGGA